MAEKSIVVLCTGEGREECPETGEIWGINGAYHYRGVSRLFITDKLYTEYPDRANFNVKEMNELGIPIISLNKIDGLTCEQYPFKKIVEHFQSDYFANSVCYLFAYALYKGIRDFDCYGVQCQLPREVVWQKACMEYWIGRIEGMGGTVNIHGDTTLLRHFTGHPYGFTEEEYGYTIDKRGALEKWRQIVDKEHWKLFENAKKLKRENDFI